MSTGGDGLTREQLMAKLDRCLSSFRAANLGDADITSVFSYFPQAGPASKLGSGGYATAYRMVRKEPCDREADMAPPEWAAAVPAHAPVAVKAIPKARLTRIADIRHLCGELAVTRTLQHRRINRQLALLHSASHVFIVLDLCEGRQPDPLTRLCLLYAKCAPHLLASAIATAREWRREASLLQQAEPHGSARAAALLDAKIAGVAAELGLRREAPLGGDVPRMIVAHTPAMPERKARVILRQVMEGLRYLHENNCVSRDVKPENCVVGVQRSVVLVAQDGARPRATRHLLASDVWCDPDAHRDLSVTAAQVIEQLDVRLVDFGHVKALDLSCFPPSSPSADLFEAEMLTFPTTFGAPSSADGGGGGDDGAVLVTAETGTPLFRALEATSGLLDLHEGQSAWQTTRRLLPKLDIFGAGVTGFCMCTRELPFRTARRGRDALEDLRRQMERGPRFPAHCGAAARGFITRLLHPEPGARPTALDALADPFLADVDDSYILEVNLRGDTRELTTAEIANTTGGLRDPQRAAAPASPGAHRGDEDAQQQHLNLGASELMAQQRVAEDAEVS